MNTEPSAKNILTILASAIALYAIIFWGIEYRRTRLGPWQVLFDSRNHNATLTINQPQLKITNLVIQFAGPSLVETNQSYSFIQPQNVPFAVPFGECVFEDTTFQPGTIVLQLFGHEIQLLPRTLTIDKQEYSWQGQSPIILNTTNTGRGVP